MSAPLTDTKRRPWLAFYPKDYLADTLHLTAAEHGAYLLLLCHYWVHGSLPSDEAMLQRVARLSAPEWAGSRDALAAFFKAGWVHSRVEREMIESAKKHEKRSNAGHLGGKSSAKSRAKSVETLPEKGQAMLQQCPTNAVAKTNHPHPQYSVSKDTGETALSLPSADNAKPDWKARLFQDGLATVCDLTGKPASSTRPLIGRWLKASRDDCRQVLRVIEDARDANPADPVAWIEAALRGPRKPPTDSLQFVMARL